LKNIKTKFHVEILTIQLYLITASVL